MNIEIRIVGKSKKYYLGHSFREGKRVIKIRRYLGSNLSEKQLQKLRKRAEEILKQQISSYKIIKDPLKFELGKNDLGLIKSLEFNINLKIKHLSEKDWKLFTELFTYSTNAIEGSEVKEKEVKKILEEDKWPKDLNKNDISETYGVAEAVDYIRKIKEHISLSLIKKLHYIVFKNSKSFAGKLRGKGVEVVIKDNLGNIIHVGAPSNRIVSLLEDLLIWYNKNRNKYPPLLLAVVVHNQFENIHPFEDGNGRVGRLLLNNILIKHRLPPVNISMNNRIRYYNAIMDYQKKGDIRPTIDLILNEYKYLNKRLGAYKNN